MLETVKNFYENEHAYDNIDTVDLSKIKLTDCIACGYCSTHKECAFKDQAQDILNTMYEYDRVLMFLPSYYCGFDANTKALIDRSFFMYNNPRDPKGDIGLVISCGATQPDNYEGILNGFKYFAMSLQKANLGYEVITNTDNMTDERLKECKDKVIKFACK